MKVLSYDPELCVGCYICEETCSDTWFKVTDAAKSSIRIHDGKEGLPPSPNAGREAAGEGLLSAVFCNQCGACIAVCPTEALHRDKNGIVRIRKKLCVGCLSCVGFCPYAAMFYHRDQVEPFKCVACGRCVDECPADALAIIEVEATPVLQGV